MKSFRVREGDLALRAGAAESVAGTDKLVQDLTLWLMEPLGSGYTTRNFGSILWNLVGRGDADALVLDVQSEVLRVLSIYQTQQYERIKAARLNGRLRSFTKREILNRILSVEANAVGNAVHVACRIQTGAGAELVIPLSITSDGVRVG